MSNLLPLQEIKKIKLLYQKRFIVIVLISLAILSVVGSICLASLYYYSKKEESALLEKKAVYEKMEVGKLKRDLVSTISDMNSRLNSFDEKRFVSPLNASFIDPILKAQDKTVSISDFNYGLTSDKKSAKVNISGVSTSREAILSFADNLRQTPGISNVDVPITNFIKESNMPFSITVTVSLK